MEKKKYIRFDWAMKRMLRDKSNYVILEGLLTTLFKEKITINRLLESESNQEDELDKYNRVDILAENSRGELFIIEVQNNDEYAYFQRMLFGVSKLVTEYINRGEGYQNIKKIYSVNIVYFDLGQGKDYLYHGKTEFLGVNTGEVLNLSPFQRQKFNVDVVSELYPEYYILKVNDFKEIPATPLEEWIYYLSTGDITNDSTAPGLNEARKKLELALMSKDELLARITMLYGGRAAEELFVGRISTGAMNDLERVTKQAYGMIAYAGMSDRLPNLCYYNNNEYSFQRPYSESTAQLIDEEVKLMVNEQYARAKQLLDEHREGHAALAELLMTREVIFAEDVEQIFGKRPWTSRSEEIMAAEEAPDEKAERVEETTLNNDL